MRRSIERQSIRSATSWSSTRTTQRRSTDTSRAINFYAERAGTIRFVVVDASDVVTWVSEPIVVSGAGAAVQDFGQPVALTAGSNLGVYSAGRGVVSFQSSGAPAAWTPNNSGLPTIGQTILEVTSSNRFRTYSMNASVEASLAPRSARRVAGRRTGSRIKDGASQASWPTTTRVTSNEPRSQRTDRTCYTRDLRRRLTGAGNRRP